MQSSITILKNSTCLIVVISLPIPRVHMILSHNNIFLFSSEYINLIKKYIALILAIIRIIFYRNSRSEVSVKKCSYEFRKIQSEFLFYKFEGQSFATLLNKKLRHRCFPKNFAKIFKNTFFILDSCGTYKRNMSPSLDKYFHLIYS